MSDFIREVDEEYRRDRAVEFFAKYQWLLVGIAIAIIAGAAGYRFWTDHNVSVAESANVRYEAALQLLREGKSAEAQTAFDNVQHDAPGGYPQLAWLKAVEALALRDPAAAAKGFDAIAADSAIEPGFRDTARIRSAFLRADLDTPEVFEKIYAPYAVDSFIFRASLRELLALAALKRGDNEAAGRWLDQIVIDPQAPSAIRNRAEGFLGLVAEGALPESAPNPVAPPAPAAPSAPAAPPPAPAASTPAK